MRLLTAIAVQLFLLNCLRFIFFKKNKLILLTIKFDILEIIGLSLLYLNTFRFIQL